MASPSLSHNKRGMVCVTGTYKWQTDTLFIRGSKRSKIFLDPNFKLCDGVDDPLSTKPPRKNEQFPMAQNEQVGSKTRNLKTNDGLQSLNSNIIGTKLPQHPKS